ncbi:hypothetical protein K502DRAFT_363707 [Neoconidiobolus thromboides FSU 785]|nr:hypothetical protein K502DRAFT_363707 [Neoconidiobolus thromboides FSU 785]
MSVHYSDITKGVNDLFTKDFPISTAKLEFKTVASNGVVFTVNGNQTPKYGIINSELKMQFNDYKNGLNITNTLNTANVLGLKVELNNKILDGLKVELNNRLTPSTNELSSQVTVSHKTHQYHNRLFADLLNGPIFNADGVYIHNGYIFGGEAGYNLKTGFVSKYNATVGYATPEYAVTIQSNKTLNEFTVGFLHRTSLTTEAGARVHYNVQSEKPVGIEVGAKHIVDKSTAIKAKIDTAGQLGLSLTHILRPGVKAIVGTSVNTSKLSEDAHKFGFSLTIEN